MIAQRIDEIATHVCQSGEVFDIYHAQDSINANALASCVVSGRIRGFVRTVHHVDSYSDRQLQEWQSLGIHSAERCLCVSRVWQEFLAREHKIHADIVPNGVSMERFSPEPCARDRALRAELRLGTGPIYLAVGGIEARKNTLNILRGFELCLRNFPGAQLIIAGGASLLDHHAYQDLFHAELAVSGIADRVVLAGPMPDADMPSLFRLADALVFPSVKEGFGLVVLEALAAQTPVVVSRIAPFTEYLTDKDCSFAYPHDPGSIAGAMLRAISPEARADAIRAHDKIAAQMCWNVSATRHLAVYDKYLSLEAQHA
jgi:glycosyltransferase-like protein